MHDDDWEWLLILGVPDFKSWQEALAFIVFVVVISLALLGLVHLLT